MSVALATNQEHCYSTTAEKLSASWGMTMRLIDRIGERYSRLRVVSRAPNIGNGDTNARWNCVCDCGAHVVCYGQDLGRGKHKSCGCLNQERIHKHGFSRTKVYSIWRTMLQRCENPKARSYPNYGARGIKVCPEWHDFQAFFRDMGLPPKGYSIDRIDNNGDYCKDNCKWSTNAMQNSNKRTNRNITWNGETHTLAYWSAATGIPYATLDSRISRWKWPIDIAMTLRPGLRRRGITHDSVSSSRS